MPLSAELVSVDLQALMDATPKRLAHAAGLVDQLKLRPSAKGEVLARGSFLPRAKRSKHYLFFHVDHDRSDDKADIFVHAVWSVRPSAPPPPDVQKRRDEGVTAERAAQALSGMGISDPEGGATFASIDVELLVEGWRPPLGAFGPVLHMGAVLEPVGAEYKAPEGAATPLTRLRWRMIDQKARVWLSFREVTDFRYGQLWDTVKAKCVELLDNLG